MIFRITASFCAFFIKGLCGFANTLIFTSIMSFGSSNINISPTELLLGYPSNIIIAFRERKSVRLKLCLPLILLVILGSIPGAFFLKNADTQIIKIICGAVIMLVGVELLLRERSINIFRQSAWTSAVIGLLSGILCGMFGIGALLGAYMSRAAKDSSAFRANLCLVFFAENTFRIILYSFWNIINFDIFIQAVTLLPIMLIGLFCGIFCGKFVSEAAAKKLVIILLIISGASLIIMNTL